MTALLAGTGMRAKKVEELCESVTTSADPLGRWAEVADELETLIDYSGGEADEPKPRTTPLLTAAGFGPKDIEKIAARLTPEEWIELTLTELDDVPQFEYRQSEGFYIDFAQASAGQQATALLRVLLNQEGPAADHLPTGVGPRQPGAPGDRAGDREGEEVAATHLQ